MKKVLFRSSKIEKEQKGEGEETIIRVSISSETPYLRMMEDPESGEYVKAYEVLGHGEGEINDERMRDGLVIQDTHDGDQIGLMRNPQIRDGKIYGEIEFCAGDRAQCIKSDAEKGLRRNMSVGYMVNEYRRDGQAEDGLPIFRVTNWTPYEASFVNVPADTNVGVGREADPNGDGQVTTSVKIPHGSNKDQIMTPEQKQKIRELASAAHVSGEEVADILLSGRAFEEVREELLNRREAYIAELAKKPAAPVSAKAATLDETTQREVRKRYNLVNVLRALASAANGERADVDIGFEREVSQEMAKKTGRAVQGILLPDFVRTAGSETLGRPDTGSIQDIGGSGRNTIETNLLAGNFIEALNDALVLEGLGMETLTGLVGNIAIPKGGSVSAGWISAEGGNAAKTNPTFGQVPASPHALGAYVDITRQLLLQSAVPVQAKVLEWLMYAAKKTIETAGFQGTGTSGQPTGISSLITNAHTKAWANTPSYEKLIELIAAVRNDNAFNPAMRFVGDNGVWSKLASTLDWQSVSNGKSGDDAAIVGGIGGVNRLLDVNTDKVLGRDFIESHCVPAKTLFFGDFSQLTLCLWSGTDIVVDPYANSTNGGLRIVALQDVDFIVKEPAAFAKATGVHA